MSRGKARAAAGPESRDLALVCADDLHISLARHQYSLGVVASTLAMVLYAGTRCGE